MRSPSGRSRSTEEHGSLVARMQVGKPLQQSQCLEKAEVDVEGETQDQE